MPQPVAVYAPIPRARVLAALIAELDWAADEADPGYALKNACRALAYAHEGVVLSKRDGLAWFRRRRPDAAFRSSGHAMPRDEARRFVADVRAELERIAAREVG
ncbi:aminoglycoside adenylyltransferase domain-containing protein [Dermacoccaceae bacterium W4C1]